MPSSTWIAGRLGYGLWLAIREPWAQRRYRRWARAWRDGTLNGRGPASF